MRLFIDDDRNPPIGEDDWIVVRDPDAAIAAIFARNDEITEISFDNDLRAAKEGWEVLRALVEAKLDRADRFPRLARIIVHSANNQAADRMLSLARNAVEHGVLPGVEVLGRPATHFEYPLAEKDGRSFETIG